MGSFGFGLLPAADAVDASVAIMAVDRANFDAIACVLVVQAVALENKNKTVRDTATALVAAFGCMLFWLFLLDLFRDNLVQLIRKTRCKKIKKM